jgi:hypothetical protein
LAPSSSAPVRRPQAVRLREPGWLGQATGNSGVEHSLPPPRFLAHHNRGHVGCRPLDAVLVRAPPARPRDRKTCRRGPSRWPHLFLKRVPSERQLIPVAWPEPVPAKRPTILLKTTALRRQVVIVCEWRRWGKRRSVRPRYRRTMSLSTRSPLGMPQHAGEISMTQHRWPPANRSRRLVLQRH